jgi:flagellar basal-body rod protein FlgB
MFDLLSSNPMIQMMDQAMTLASRRMTLIAGNLANIDTPNYQTRDFSFESAFKAATAAMTGTGGTSGTGGQNSPGFQSLPSYFPGKAATPAQDPDAPAGDSASPTYERNDLNDVSLDQQNMLMAKTLNIYQMSSEFAQAELRRVLGAIRDGAK